MYQSILRPGEVVIDDDVRTTPPLASSGYECRDWSENPFGSVQGATPFPDELLIPRNDWAELIREREAGGSLLSTTIDAKVPCKNQKSTNYCWGFGVVGVVEVIRVAAGFEYVSLSPASVCAPLRNFKNQGYWGTPALRFIGENGIVPSEFWPDTAIDRQYYTEENKARAKDFRVTEWWELDEGEHGFEQMMSCLLRGLPVPIGYAWWSHLTYACDPMVFSDGQFGHRNRNSWSASYGTNGFFTVKGKKAWPNDACCPRVPVAKAA